MAPANCPNCGICLSKPRRRATPEAAAKRRASSLHSWRPDEIAAVEQFGAELRAVREALGMTRAQLAKAARLSESLVRDAEIGGRRIRRTTLDRLVLGLTPAPPVLSMRGATIRTPGDPAVRAAYQADPAEFSAQLHRRLEAVLGSSIAPSGGETRRRLGKKIRGQEAVTGTL